MKLAERARGDDHSKRDTNLTIKVFLWYWHYWLWRLVMGLGQHLTMLISSYAWPEEGSTGRRIGSMEIGHRPISSRMDSAMAVRALSDFCSLCLPFSPFLFLVFFFFSVTASGCLDDAALPGTWPLVAILKSFQLHGQSVFKGSMRALKKCHFKQWSSARCRIWWGEVPGLCLGVKSLHYAQLCGMATAGVHGHGEYCQMTELLRLIDWCIR